MSRCSVVFIFCLVVSLSAPGSAHAQMPGQIPVFVDTSGTLGNSNMAQDNNGNLSATNGTDNPVLAVSNTSPDFGFDAVLGQSPNGNGVHGQSSNQGASGVYGENIGSTAGYGVAGRAFGVGGTGVFGDGTSSGAGVEGVSVNGIGVIAASTGPGGRALLALSQGGGTAAIFQGLVEFAQTATGGATPLCLNSTFFLATCSSSLRYKTDVRPFRSGFDIVKHLRPISFTWKEGGKRDIGLGAEDVEQVEPLLTFRNEKGEIEGVKYNQLSAVFVNAFLEQQAQIEKQQDQIDALTALVCQSHPDAGLCR